MDIKDITEFVKRNLPSGVNEAFIDDIALYLKTATKEQIDTLIDYIVNKRFDKVRSEMVKTMESQAIVEEWSADNTAWVLATKLRKQKMAALKEFVTALFKVLVSAGLSEVFGE